MGVRGASMASDRKRIDRARALRQSDVPAEALLWKALRNRALGGFKFRRQHPIGHYFADFACVECQLVIELDGETHLGRHTKDEGRTRFFESQGWRVQRFWNTQVYDELEAVKEAIGALCLQLGEA